MALDPSIPLGIKPPQFPSGLDLAQQLQALQAKRNENLLFDLNTAAQQRVGQIMGRPDVLNADGTFNIDAARRLALTDPMSQFLAPKMDQFFQERAQRDAVLQQQQVQAVMAVTQAVATEFAPLVGREDLTQQDITRAASRLITKFQGNPGVVKHVIAELQGLPNGPEALRAWVEGKQLQATTALERLQAIAGTPTPTNLGADVAVTQTPIAGPRAGTVTEAGRLPTSLPPAAAAQPVPVQTPTGTPGLTTVGALDEAVAGTKAPTGTVPMVPAGPAPGVVEVSTEGAKAFVAQSNALNESIDAGDRANINVQKMMQMLPLIETGRLSGVRTELAAVAEALGLSKDIVGKIQGGLNDESLPAAQEFMKLVWEQSLLRLRSQLPPGTQLTQAEWIRTAENNPNILLTATAVEGMANYMQQMQRYLTAKREFMQQWQMERQGQTLNWGAADNAWRQEAIKRGLLKVDDFKKPPKPFAYPPMFQGAEGALKLQQLLERTPVGVTRITQDPATGKQYKIRKTEDGAPVNVAD